jgi:hypothetical protein
VDFLNDLLRLRFAAGDDVPNEHHGDYTQDGHPESGRDGG